MTRALILVGHGSHLNADSSAPVYAHSAAIRASGAFDEVHEAFWKEEPPLTSVLHLSDADEVLIVPLFLSEGYFTREVLPREIGLSGSVMRKGRQTFRYLPPVGTHPAMTTMILRRADRVLGSDSRRRGDAALVVIGHGTERNATSADTVYGLVESLQARGEFASVAAGFLDEAPYIPDVLTALDAPEVVLVPFFVAEGWHTRETIPAELGLSGEVTVREGRTLWYTPPVGTLPEMVDVILEMTSERPADPSGDELRAEDGGRSGPGRPAGSSLRPPVSSGLRSPAHHGFLAHLELSGRRAEFMDVLIEPAPDGCFAVRHLADRAAVLSDLTVHRDPQDARDIARFRADGSYRAMRSTRDLRTGWVFSSLDADGLWRVLSLLYPAALGDWFRGNREHPEPNHFGAWAGRQTAMYAEVRELEPGGVAEVAAGLCTTCHRSRIWRDDRSALSDLSDPAQARPGSGSGLVVPCVEPCTMFATRARELMQKRARGAAGQP